MTVRAEHLGFAGTSPPKAGRTMHGRHHTGLTARDPGGVHAGAARPARRAGGCVPVYIPPAESGTTAGMRGVITRAG